MPNSASQFVGDIPSHYDAGLGPNIFEGFAAGLVHRACDQHPLSVLELAAGTGIVSRMLRDQLPPEAMFTCTDLNAPMLDVARSKFSAGENITFATADAMALPFEDSEFDLMVCQFGVMFFPDKVTAFREARRVLKNEGTYLFNVWGTLEDNPFAHIAHEVSTEFFPDNPPGFYKVPFSYADAATVMRDLDGAGFTTCVHERVQLEKKVDDFHSFALGLVFGNPLIDEIKSRGTVRPEAIAERLESRLREAFAHSQAVMPLIAIAFAAS